MTEELLREEANKARTIAVALAENIYKYLGGVISKEALKDIVDSAISDDILIRFDHLYIKKDTYENTFISGFLDDISTSNIDDTETLIIKDKENSKEE